MTLPDRYASGFALWKAEHPRSRAQGWGVGRRTVLGRDRCVVCGQTSLRRFARNWSHLDKCTEVVTHTLRAVCVRWLCALPEVHDDALPWLRALPQEDQDAVVVARAQ